MILHSRKIGEGKPFIILHGFLGMGGNWKTLGRRFALLGCEVHLVDQRNHGRSFHADEFGYEILAKDLLQYCRHNNISDCILLGHSMGGKTAMEFATRNPEIVSKLIVVDITPKEYPQHHHEILKALSLLDFSEIKSRGEADIVLSEYIKEVGIRLFLLKNLYWKEKEALGLRINLPVLTEKIKTIGVALPKEAVFNKDVLFIGGGKSGYIEPIDEILIKKHFPKAQVEMIQDAGHWVHAEKPEEFYNIAAGFLSLSK